MYVRRSDTGTYPLILWSPVRKDSCHTLSLKSLEELQEIHPEFSIHSRYFPNYNGALFKGREHGNYQILQDFPGSNSAVQLPIEISKFLGQTGKYIGAYPTLQ